MLPHIPWELEEGDLIGFGGESLGRNSNFERQLLIPFYRSGPETIMARRSHVQNPFIFVFNANDATHVEANNYSGLAELAASGHRAIALDHDDEEEEEEDDDGDIEMMLDIPQPPLQVAPRLMSTRSKRIAEQSAADAAHASLMSRKHGTAVDDTRRRLDQQLAGAVDKVKGSKGRGSSSKKGKKVKTSSEALGTPGVKMKEILSTHLSCAICQDWLVACHALSCGHM